MHNNEINTREQLEQLAEQVGQPLLFNIYLDNIPVATQGTIITKELVQRLRRVEERHLHFSREDLGRPETDEDIQELIMDQLAPARTEILEQAGVKEDISEEARRAAARKIKDIFEACRFKAEVDVTAATELASDLVDRTGSFVDTGFKLSDLHNLSEYHYYHAVNACVLGTTLFRDQMESQEELEQLGLGLLLFDIGKLRIPEEILNKPGRLTKKEVDIIKTHVTEGYDMVKDIDYLSDVTKNMVLNHHERINGSGYTRGLREADLSTFDMIANVCDAFDATTSNRVYRSRIDIHRAVSVLIRGAGVQFNTRIVNIFLRGIGRFPVGTFVLLSTGEVGVVSRLNTNALSLPVIRIIFDARQNRLDEPRTVDLYEQREVYIDRALDVSYCENSPKLLQFIPSH
jgi:HD-GYP domain-containing protein (c-di-GMP phosphodiesterase class II)